VKAIDLTAWRQMGDDIMRALQQMTNAFQFERSIVEACTDRRMGNVVRGIAHGQEQVGEGPFSEVSYLILELADGDLRAALDPMEAIDAAWALSMLHNVANGFRQLHGAGMSHQDTKPSNVMTFASVAKLGDLGRSFWAGTNAPHTGAVIPGDANYAPPECLYGQIENDEILRSREIDAYHLGSMIRFIFTKTGATAALWRFLDPAFYPGRWMGLYSDVLPHLRDAFDAAMEDFEIILPSSIRNDVIQLVRELCDPDPSQRGIGNRRKVERYSMERYVSRLDLLSKRALVRGRSG